MTRIRTRLGTQVAAESKSTILFIVVRLLTKIVRKRLNIFSVVHPAEVFPLAIAIAAVVQAIIFIAVQSRALTTFWSNGCRLTSELIWPGKFE